MCKPKQKRNGLRRDCNKQLMVAKELNLRCRKIDYLRGICEKTVLYHFEEVYEISRKLQNILSCEHLKIDFKYVQRLTPTSKCTEYKKIIEKKSLFLKSDIDGFYDIFGKRAQELYENINSTRCSRKSDEPESNESIESNETDESMEFNGSPEECELVTRFCTQMHELYHAWEDLYIRIRGLEEMVKSDGQQQMQSVQTHPLNFLYTVTKTNRHSRMSIRQLEERMHLVRKSNRKLNVALREYEFELSKDDLKKRADLEKAVATKGAEDVSATSARQFLKRFDEQMTKLKIDSTNFRLLNVQKCLMHEEMIMHFCANDNFFAPNLKQKANILDNIIDFFLKVRQDFNLFSVKLELLKDELNQHCSSFKH